MVSLWPWRQDPTSAESFEKTLSALAVRISKASAHHDRIRQRARKLKVGWTIYGGFIYIVCGLIFTLVTGWRNWGTMEYTVISGGPVLLYTVRYVLTSWYNYRISNATDNLEALYKERDSTIEKLKQATKYNSTQQLLEKYGSSKPATKSKKENVTDKSQKNKQKRQSDAGRTLMAPPPTANIPRRSSGIDPEQQPITSNLPPNPNLLPSEPGSPRLDQAKAQAIIESAEFAPNAFDPPTQYAPAPSLEPKWYDRLVNALLGEDETRPDSRLALICQQCRLVNGLAPPGARTPEEVGKWKCSSCGAWNGIEIPEYKNATPSHSRQPSAVADNVEGITRKEKSDSAEPLDSASEAVE